ncbi:NIPSNAP family protein [Parabacteroides sp. OttesenSCG-928-O15]|nr:NIPSNAP family protein [Parabacteroides sp. OttesenSCG-928-O15]
MERRRFVKTASALAIIPAVKSWSSSTPAKKAAGKEIYEWRFYTLKGEGDRLDAFYRDTFIPAFKRFGIKVGAFAPHQKGEKDMRYYLFIYPDMATYLQVKEGIWADTAFREKAQPFYEQTAPAPLYENMETFLCEAFDKIPVHRVPGRERTLFEIRLYWSPNEEANRRKVAMFNKDEIAIFDKTGINSVCYGNILAGPRMPALIYLTWYKDVATRTEAWNQFGAHPDWQRIRGLPEYAHTATANKSILLSPLAYSEL